MKTAFAAAGMVCAWAASAAAQQSDTDLGGSFGSFGIELNESNGYFVRAGGVPVSKTTDQTSEATLLAPEPWEFRSQDSLEAGPSVARSQFEAFVASESTRLEGGISISADAFSSPDDGGSSTRLFHDLNVTAEGIDTIADVLIELDANASVSGFGRSILSYSFRSDEFDELGFILPDENGRVSVFFESINISFLDIAFTAVTEAGTDAPVLNASADLNAMWSVEIVPIPAPGSAVGLAGLGLLSLRRRR
ncbi:MAG: hypothetical protein AAFR76_01255 [Planctomycetota bacterium]